MAIRLRLSWYVVVDDDVDVVWWLLDMKVVSTNGNESSHGLVVDRD